MKKKIWSLLLVLLLAFSFGTLAIANESEFVGGIGALSPEEAALTWQQKDGVWGYFPAEAIEDQPVTLQLENGESLTLVQVNLEEKVFTAVTQKELAVALQERESVAATTSSVSVRATQASPTWFHIWPYPATSVNPEDQYYWYKSSNDTIYIAVANAVPTVLGVYLNADQIPYHVGVAGKLNGATKAEETSMRHRLFMSATSNGWGIKFGTSLYMNMGSAGSSHVGYVHFFPLWVFSKLTAYPTGYFEARDGTGKQAYQTIRFSSSVGFTFLPYQYVP